MKNYRGRRQKNIYSPGAKQTFRLSRSKIESFVRCARCFYLDRRMGLDHPPGYPFNLNRAVDNLLKNEFDAYRSIQKPHPLMVEFRIPAVPFQHQELETWRTAPSKGVQHLHRDTSFLITGAIDDVWLLADGQIAVVDYKATSKNSQITLEEDWKQSYKRQIEIYQWLFRKNNFAVSDTGYFVYCNGDANRDQFGDQLHFDTRILPYTGDCGWVEPTIFEIFACLNSNSYPEPSPDCEYCLYRRQARELGF